MVHRFHIYPGLTYSLALLLILTACTIPAMDIRTEPPLPTLIASMDSTIDLAQATFTPTVMIPTMPAITETAQIPPHICAVDVCVFPGHFIFQPPIGADFNQKVEWSYPYGGTQHGEREPHHGVEFINALGTPVLAVGDGEVIFAGTDSNQQVGWGVNFYGNLVVIQHEVPGYNLPIFTLYGHLSKILAKTGDRIGVGEKIGEVGLSGKAIGSHLHFEIREGINDYAHTRNPELWINTNNASGAVVVQIFNDNNETRRYPDFVLTSLDDTDFKTRYPVPYADSSLNGDDLFEEVMAVADLQEGMYELAFSPYGVTQRIEFEIFPYKVTRLIFHTRY